MLSHASTGPSRHTTPPLTPPNPKRHDVRPTPPRPKSNKKKVVCPAGNKCDCGTDWDCPTCGRCIEGCAPPCPEALKQIEKEKMYKKLWEEVRGEAPSADPAQPGTSSGSRQPATLELQQPDADQTPPRSEVSKRYKKCKKEIYRVFESFEDNAAEELQPAPACPMPQSRNLALYFTRKPGR